MRWKKCGKLYRACADIYGDDGSAGGPGFRKGEGMYSSFLVKYAEIAIKGKNRHYFEDALVGRIYAALRNTDGEFAVRREQGRIYVDALGDYDPDEVVDALRCVFGIVGICPVAITED